MQSINLDQTITAWSELIKPQGSIVVRNWASRQPVTSLFTTTITQAEILFIEKISVFVGWALPTKAQKWWAVPTSALSRWLKNARKFCSIFEILPDPKGRRCANAS